MQNIINELLPIIVGLESFQTHMNEHGTLPKQINQFGEMVDFKDNRAACSNFGLNDLRRLTLRAHFNKQLKQQNPNESYDLKEFLFLSFATTHTPYVSVIAWADEYMDYPVGGEDEFDEDMENWTFWENKKRHALVDYLIVELKHLVTTGEILDLYNILEDIE